MCWSFGVVGLEWYPCCRLLLFYFTSYVLNMFRTLIYPSSGACDSSVELPHWSIVLGSMCAGVSVCLGWSGIRIAGLCAQHVSYINISIIRSLRLFCWIITLVVLFLARCMLEFRCGWVGVVSVLQSYVLNMFRALIYPSSGACDYSVELPHWSSYCSWFDVCCSFGVVGLEAEACNTDTTRNQPHRNFNTHRTKNNTTNVVIQQNSRKLLMMDILMSETCWAHKKWNKIASNIKLVFYSSTIKSGHIYKYIIYYCILILQIIIRVIYCQRTFFLPNFIEFK